MSGGKRGPGRDGGGGLTPEDQRLWEQMTSDIKPLRGRPVERPVSPVSSKDRSGTSSSKRRAPVTETPVFERRLPDIKPQRSFARELDRRTEEKLRRGKMAVEGRLDLHGHSQDEAHQLLHDFVMAAQAQGKRCVLVITGKGTPRASANFESGRERGVLRRRVPEWLSTPPLQDVVLKSVRAQPKDGGDGALYVYLKRDRG